MDLDTLADRGPPMRPERFFAGTLQGWGMELGPLGGVGRRIEIRAQGRFDPASATLFLDETYRFDDGQTDVLRWRIRVLGEGNYEASEARAPEPGQGRAEGAGFRLTYRRDVPHTDGGSTTLGFDDLFVQLDPQTVMVRASITKLAVPIGSLTVLYRRDLPDSGTQEPHPSSAD